MNNYFGLALGLSKAARNSLDAEEVLYFLDRLRALTPPRLSDKNAQAEILDQHRALMDSLDHIATRLKERKD